MPVAFHNSKFSLLQPILCSTSEVERKIQVLVSLRQICLCEDTTVSHHFASCVFPDSRYTTTNHFEVCKLGRIPVSPGYEPS